MSPRHPVNAPAVARLLVRVLLPSREAEFILGDLDEEYAEEVLGRLGPGGARAWYWTMALRSIGERWRPSVLVFRLGLRRTVARKDLWEAPIHVRMTTRGGTVMERFRQDATYALRALKRQPGFTAVTLATLALGIGSTTAIFSVVDGVLLRPLPFDGAERYVHLSGVYRSESVEIPGLGVADASFLEYRRRLSSFEALEGFNERDVNVIGDGPPETVQGAEVTAGLFDMLGIRPILGRTFREDESRKGAGPVAMLGHGVWTTRFAGDPDVLGRTVRLDDTEHVIVGILPRGFHFPGEARIWIPKVYAPTWAEARFGGVTVVGKLRAGLTMDVAAEETLALAKALAEEYPDSNTGFSAQLAEYRATLVNDSRRNLLLLLGAVAVVLIIACTNVANLLITRALERAHEMAVRASLGASRLRIMSQLITESLVLAALGGALGVGLATWALRAILVMAPSSLPRVDEITLDARSVLFALALSVVTGILFGLFPALQGSRLDPGVSLRDGSGRTTGPGRSRMRETLLVGEVAQALVLLVVAGLLVNTLVRMNRADPGFDPEQVLSVHLDLPRYAYPEYADRSQLSTRLVDAVRAVPGVVSVGASTASPFRGRTALAGMSVEGGLPEGASTGLNVFGSGEVDFWLEWSLVTPDYFESLGVPLLKGRALVESDITGTELVAVINESTAEAIWPGQSPIGKRMGSAGRDDWYNIVGVVGDVRHPGLPTPTGAALYAAYGRTALLSSSSYNLVVRTAGDPLDAIEDVRAAIWGVDPDIPIPSAIPMEQRFSTALASARFLAALLATFSALAVLMAAVGIYGVVAHQVSRRTHEMGIRMALGARREEVVALVFGRGLRLVGLGLALGLAGAWAAVKLVDGLLYGIEPTDPVTFAVVAVFLAAVAALANYVPARRATHIDPIRALRAD